MQLGIDERVRIDRRTGIDKQGGKYIVHGKDTVVRTTRTYCIHGLLVSRCLANDVEVGVREPVGLDALEDPPERCSVRHVGRLHLSRTTSEYSTNTTTDVSND